MLSEFTDRHWRNDFSMGYPPKMSCNPEPMPVQVSDGGVWVLDAPVQTLDAFNPRLTTI